MHQVMNHRGVRGVNKGHTRKEQGDGLERVKQECERLVKYPAQRDNKPVLTECEQIRQDKSRWTTHGVTKRAICWWPYYYIGKRIQETETHDA